MNGWDGDKAWSDVFIPQVCDILSSVLKVPRHCVTIADLDNDQKHNADLFVACSGFRLSVACRIRENKWMRRCRDEFTIRSIRTSGRKTELTKIREGYGDLMFYGFANADASAVEQWRILNLHAFRRWLGDAERPECETVSKSNTDGSSKFVVYRVADIPGVVAFESCREVLALARPLGHDEYGNTYPPSWDLI